MFCDTMCTTLNSGLLQCFGLYFTWNDHRINNGSEQRVKEKECKKEMPTNFFFHYFYAIAIAINMLSTCTIPHI